MQAIPTHTADCGPHQLAHTVLRALSVSALDLPEEPLLELLFDVLYQASFRAENGASVTGRVIWQSAVNRPDSAKSSHLLLRPPVPLNVGSLTSLLASIDGSSALLVSSGGAHSPVIHGIVRGSRGLFEVEVLGPAHLKVDAGLDSPLELRRNRLSLSNQRVLSHGPVRRRLSVLLSTLFPSVKALLPGDVTSSPLLTAGALPLPGGAILLSDHDWPETLEQYWVDALTRLLRCVFDTRLGGSVLLTPHRDPSPRREDWQPAPQEAAYSHLRDLLEKKAVQGIVEQVRAVQRLSEHAAPQDIPADDLMLQEPGQPLEPLEKDPEITAAIQFLASLSRVNGVLRLDPQLDLISFGGSPSSGRLPERVYLAGSELAEDTDLSPISTHSFGPRSQALLRLCTQDPDAVGFAFTQDGDVRAMLWHEEKLVVWNSVLLPNK